MVMSRFMAILQSSFHKSSLVLFLAILISSCVASPLNNNNNNNKIFKDDKLYQVIQSSENERRFEPRSFREGEDMSQETIEKELSDPQKEWNRVKNDPDFLLMNGEDVDMKKMRRAQHIKRRMASSVKNNDNLAMLEALLSSGQPLYYDLPSDHQYLANDQTALSRGNYNHHLKTKRGKMMRLSLTDNLDVLREKLFMEIARRNRLMNQEQVSMANANLVNIG